MEYKPMERQDESVSGNPRRRRSVSVGRVLPSETSEVSNKQSLAGLKEGRRHNLNAEADRMSILMMRNSLCPPHLKSSYPAETQFLNPNGPKENEIKESSGRGRVLQGQSSRSRRRRSSSTGSLPRTATSPSKRLRALFPASG